MEVKEPTAQYLARPARVLTSAGELPEDWSVQPLGELMRLLNGRAFGPDEWSDTGLPIIRIQNLNSTDSEFNLFAGPVDERNIVRHGDLLFAWSGTTGSSFGARIWTGDTGVLNQHIFKVIPDLGKLTPAFAYRLLLTAQYAIERQAHGFKASFVHVKKSDLISVSAGFPPTLDEQNRIAEALTHADALIDSLEQLLTKKRRIKQGAMQEHFHPARLTCRTMKLEQISGFITKGATPTTYGFGWVSEGIVFLRSECVSTQGLDLAQSMFISEKAHMALSRSAVSAGDLLMTITGNVGRVARATLECNINQHIARIRVIDPEVNSDFVYHQLSRNEVRQELESITTGQAYPQLSLKQVRERVIRLPELEEQNAIAKMLSDMDSNITALESRLTKARALKQAMAQALLTGRIRLVAAAAASAS